jgi:predicted nucleic acid-binding protein
MSANRFILDTNIFILLFNDRLLDALPDGELGCSVITEMELLSHPSLTASEEALIQERLSVLTVYGIDVAVKEETIRLRRSTRLKLPDAIIAATVIVYDAVLLTNDTALHHVSGLVCRSLATKG